jgi:hypothetical protein
MRFPFCFPIADHRTTILIVVLSDVADVRLVIEIKPFKPVGQDDQSGVDNQGLCIDRSCEQAPAIDRPHPTKG